MPKESRNFRLDPEALATLRRLADKWSVSQTHALELIIKEAGRQNRELQLVKADN
jgi:hypothetical protein